MSCIHVLAVVELLRTVQWQGSWWRSGTPLYWPSLSWAYLSIWVLPSYYFSQRAYTTSPSTAARDLPFLQVNEDPRFRHHNYFTPCRVSFPSSSVSKILRTEMGCTHIIGPRGLWWPLSVASTHGTLVSSFFPPRSNRITAANVTSCPDKTGERFLHMTGWWWLAMIGFIIALSTMSIAARYVSLFLMACALVGEWLRCLTLEYTHDIIQGRRWILYGYPTPFLGLQRT